MRRDEGEMRHSEARRGTQRLPEGNPKGNPKAFRRQSQGQSEGSQRAVKGKSHANRRHQTASAALSEGTGLLAESTHVIRGKQKRQSRGNERHSPARREHEAVDRLVALHLMREAISGNQWQ